MKKQRAKCAAEVTGDQKDRQGECTRPSAEWIPQPGCACKGASAHHTRRQLTTSFRSCLKCGRVDYAGSGALLRESLGESWEFMKTEEAGLLPRVKSRDAPSVRGEALHSNLHDPWQTVLSVHPPARKLLKFLGRALEDTTSGNCVPEFIC